MLRSASDSTHSAGKGRFGQSQYFLVVGSDMPLPGDLVVAYGPYCVAKSRWVQSEDGLDIVSVDQTHQELLGICKKAEVDEELIHHEA